ncbi:MAG: PH domain-containing protein [Methanobrevibacter thaueri]|jgi:membrane protein YdbS with pleckstrin-like domain|uniref:PH domain-containing protein n=1 Tax=Methanobrevibacter thaueri TaxID=190975 RepID=UPI0026EAFF62|nr:PH domain-containing protein [Methanobrevibacter thaueri]MBE6495497.1 PH domain-containing protein [Methanobrevibacter thaueri]
MLFDKNDENVRDRVIYKAKPNMLLGCKKAIYGIVLLAIILMVSPIAIRFIGEMQVYLISYVKLSLTRYAAIAFFVIILIDVLYIIWQLIGWYSLEYTLTETKIIIKSGVLSTKKNYMPYATIQDINTSQSIFGKMMNVGSVSLFSAYDNNQMEIKNISNPSEVEEIIFSRMVGQRNFQAPPQRFPPQQNTFERDFREDDYLGRNEYYDEYEPITPITHENTSRPRREYEYYPEDFDTITPQHHTYEYEPYSDRYNNPSNGRSQDNYYNQIRDEYSMGGDDYYHNNNPQSQYNEGVEKHQEIEPNDVDDASQDVIRRHFDKFKR